MAKGDKIRPKISKSHYLEILRRTLPEDKLINPRLNENEYSILQEIRKSGIPQMQEVITVKEDKILEDLKKILMNRTYSIEDLSNRFNVPPKEIRNRIDQLKNQKFAIQQEEDGEHVTISTELKQGGRHLLNPDMWLGDKLQFGFTADNHLCFPPNTVVTTQEGYKKICKISVGDMVLTHKNRFRRVNKIISHKYSGKFLKINLRGDKSKNGGSDKFASVICTPDHPFLCVRNNMDVWVPAKDLIPSDLIRVQGHKCRDCDNIVPPWFKVCKDCDTYVKAKGIAHITRFINSIKKGNRHFKEDVLPEMEKWEQDGFRVIPIDCCRPDFIAFKDNKIIAVEVEAPITNYRPKPILDKYKNAGVEKYYDDIHWILKDKRKVKRNCKYDYYDVNEYGFPSVSIQSIEEVDLIKDDKYLTVYNLEVEEDNSYIAKRFVVHNCSHYERLDLLNLLYDIYEKEGIQTVYNAGNWIDGEARFNKNEIHVKGMTKQIEYAVKNYPYRKGIETHFVSGDDHEGWYNQREGINIGEYFQMKREQAGMFDLKHLGYLEADIALNDESFEHQSWLRVLHPGGGSAYATSYAAQKIIESLQGGEKPNILLIGHYHKLLYAYIRNVHTIQCGTTSDQSLFMRKQKIEAHVGGGIVTLFRAPDGIINGCSVRFITAFDKKFYIGKDKYWK